MEGFILAVVVGGWVIALTLSAENPTSPSQVPAGCLSVATLATAIEAFNAFRYGLWFGGLLILGFCAVTAIMAWCLHEEADLAKTKSN